MVSTSSPRRVWRLAKQSATATTCDGARSADRGEGHDGQLRQLDRVVELVARIGRQAEWGALLHEVLLVLVFVVVTESGSLDARHARHREHVVEGTVFKHDHEDVRDTVARGDLLHSVCGGAIGEPDGELAGAHRERERLVVVVVVKRILVPGRVCASGVDVEAGVWSIFDEDEYTPPVVGM